jgi:hypothetical protein
MQSEAEQFAVTLCNMTLNQPTHPCIESLYPLYDDCNFDIVLGEQLKVVITYMQGLMPVVCLLKAGYINFFSRVWLVILESPQLRSHNAVSIN